MSQPVSTRRIRLIQRDHRRTFQENLYVYAVVSRRSKGVSIGINLNPDKVCNFDCIYCQVDRVTPAVVRGVDLARFREELEDMLDLIESGKLFEMERFRDTPPEDDPVVLRLLAPALLVPTYRLADTGDYLAYSPRLRAPFDVLLAADLPAVETDATPFDWPRYRHELTAALGAAGVPVETIRGAGDPQ